MIVIKSSGTGKTHRFAGKKALAIVLAVVLTLSVFTVAVPTVFAEWAPAGYSDGKANQAVNPYPDSETIYFDVTAVKSDGAIFKVFDFADNNLDWCYGLGGDNDGFDIGGTNQANVYKDDSDYARNKALSLCKVNDNIWKGKVINKNVGSIQLLRMSSDGNQLWGITARIFNDPKSVSNIQDGKRPDRSYNCIKIKGYVDTPGYSRNSLMEYEWIKYPASMSSSASTYDLTATAGSNFQNGVNNGSLIKINATFYDYYTDDEVMAGWRNIASLTSRGEWEPYQVLNKKIASTTTTSYPLYFGNFYKVGDNYSGYGSSGLQRFKYLPNNSNGLKDKFGSYSYSVQGLAGAELRNNNITFGDKNGTTGYEVMPYFDKQWLSSNHLGTVVSTEFPMRVDESQGYKKYVFQSAQFTNEESTPAIDTVYFDGYGSGTNNLTIEYAGNGSKAVKDSHSKYGGERDGYGFLPFDKYTDHDGKGRDFGFGMRTDVNFNVNKYGTVNGKSNGAAQTFEFSGDDDVWVYIDGKLVLDLGGDHKVAEGVIDFKNCEVRVSTGVCDVNGNSKQSTKSFDFNNTDGKKHTLTMFYTERGISESNLKFGFSFTPLDNDLVVDKTVNTEGINAGLQGVVEAAESFKFGEVKNKAYTFKNQDGETSGKTTGSAGTFDLKDQESADFNNQFTVGDDVKITETYSGNLSYTTTWSLADKVYTTAQAETGSGAEAEFNFKTFKPNADQWDPTALQLSYVNKLNLGSVTIKKTVSSQLNSDLSKKFPVTVLVQLGSETPAAYPLVTDKGTLSAAGEIEIGNAETITINNLPVGAKIYVKETDSKDLTKSYKVNGAAAAEGANGVSVTVPATGAGNAEIAVTNTREAVTSAKVQLRVNKILENAQNQTPADGKFTFGVYKNLTDTQAEVTATNSGKSVTFPEMSFSSAGVKTYYIKETAGSDANIEFSSSVIKVEFEITFDSANNKFVLKDNKITYKDNSTGATITNPSFTNKVKTDKVEITKSVKKGGSDYATNEEFRVKVTFTAPNTYGAYVLPMTYYIKGDTAAKTIDSEGYITIKKDQTAVIEGLPLGTTVTVAEDVPEGYQASNIYSNGNTLVSGGKVTILNDRMSDGEISFPVQKTLSAQLRQAGYNAQDFKAELYEGTAKLDTKTFNADGSASFKRTFDSEGTHTYTIKEYATASDGNIVFDTAVYTVKVKVQNVNNALTASITEKSKDGAAFLGNTYTFANDYKKGNVQIKKSVLDFYGNALSDHFTAKVELLYPGATAYTTYKESLDIYNNSVETIENLPVGTKVKVTETAVDNFDASPSDTVEITVAEGNASESNNVNFIALTNTRQAPAPADISFNAKKLLTADAAAAPVLEADRYQFVLEGNGVSIYGWNDANGNVAFEKINFLAEAAAVDNSIVVPVTVNSEKQTYSFDIYEIDYTNDVVKYDRTVKTVTVDVTYDKENNKLVATSSDAATVYEFENIVRTGEVTITKTVDGYKADGNNETFKATVYVSYNKGVDFVSLPFYYTDSKGEKKQLEADTTGTGDFNGKYVWQGFKHGDSITIKGLPVGAVVKVVEETDTRYTAVYTVADNNDNETIVVAESTPTDYEVKAEPIKITNTRKTPAPVKAQFEASKALSGAELESGQFSFALYKKGETNPIETVTNGVETDASKIRFSEITYNASELNNSSSKTYEYEIREVKNTEDTDVAYSDEVVTVKVVLTYDAAANELKKTVTYGSDTEFNNTLNKGQVQIVKVVKDSNDNELTNDATEFDATVTVSYNGGYSLTATSYPFTYSDGGSGTLSTAVNGTSAVSGTVKLKEGRTITVKDLPVNATVTVNETQNVKYDVPVVENNGTTPAEAKVIKVTNVLQAPGAITLDAVKNLSDVLKKAGYKPSDFTFSAVDDKTGTELGTASVDDATGKITFNTITYTEADTYTYTITETAPTDAGNVLYNTEQAVYKVTVEVTKDNATNKLNAVRKSVSKTYTENGQQKTVAADSVVFNNDIEHGKVIITKQLKDAYGNDIVTNDTFSGTASISYKGDGTVDKTENFTFNIKDGKNTYVINDLPVGATVTVAENLEPGSPFTAAVSADGNVNVVKGDNNVVITNTRELPSDASIPFDARKLITADTYSDAQLGTYTFCLKGTDNSVIIESQNNAQGDISFGSVLFTADPAATGDNVVYVADDDVKSGQVKEFHFDVYEKDDDTAELITSKVIGKAVVKVSYDSAQNKLVATSDSSTQAYEFTNTVRTGKVTITKTVDGYKADSNDDTFTATISVSYNGGQSFVSLPFYVMNNGVKTQLTAKTVDGTKFTGEYQWTFTKNDSITIEGLPVGTIVKVTEDGKSDYTTVYKVNGGDATSNGEVTVLTVTDADGIKVQDGKIEIVNTRQNPDGVSVVLEAKKTLTGADLVKNAFEFNVLDENKNVVVSAKNGIEGDVSKVRFPAISYTPDDMASVAVTGGKATKVYNYTIVEKKGNDGSITYSETEIPVTVTVVYTPADNKLTATPAYPQGNEFTNTFVTKDVTIKKITTQFDGTTPYDTNDEFTVSVVINYGSTYAGYTKPTTYEYTNADGTTGTESLAANEIKLVNGRTAVIKGLPLGTTVSVSENVPAEYAVEYKVNDGEFKTSCDVLNAGDTAVVKNKLQKPDSAEIKARKIFTGAPMAADSFKFVLKDSNGVVLQTKGNTASGDVLFDKITYTEEGVFNYTIEEIEKNDPDVIYATDTYKAVVSVAKNAQNELKTSIKYYDSSDNEVTAAVFENKLRTGKAVIEKTDQNNDKIDDIVFGLYKIDAADVDSAKAALTRDDVLAMAALSTEKTQNGKVEFANLKLFRDDYTYGTDGTKYQVYCIAELRDENGRTNINGELHFFTVPANGEYELTYKYVNGKIVTPVTGGEGMNAVKTVGIAVVGAALLLMAAYVVMKKRSSKKYSHMRTK